MVWSSIDVVRGYQFQNSGRNSGKLMDDNEGDVGTDDKDDDEFLHLELFLLGVILNLH